MVPWFGLALILSHIFVLYAGPRTSKKLMECRPGGYMVDFSYRFDRKTTGIGCHQLEKCTIDTICSWAPSCKESSLNNNLKDPRLFVAGVMTRMGPKNLRFKCCQAYKYHFNNCISKSLAFNRYLHLTLSTLLGKYKKTSDKIITNVKTVATSASRTKQTSLIVEICTFTIDRNGICPADRPKEPKVPKQEKPDEGLEQPQGKKSPDQSLMQHPDEIQLTEEEGIAGLKWMQAGIAGGVAGGVAGGTTGLVIALAFTPCDQFQIEGATVVYSPDQDPVPAFGTGTITCDDDAYELIGPSEFTCLGRGEWDEDELEPYCEPKGCPKLTVKATSTATIINSEEDGDLIPHGATADVMCEDTNTMIGQYTCNGDQWEVTCTDTETCWAFYGDEKTEGFHKVFSVGKDFEEAKIVCGTECAQLVTVHNEGEQTHIKDLYEANTEIDTGIKGAWVGMTRSAGGDKGPAASLNFLQWIDGTLLDDAYSVMDMPWREGKETTGEIAPDCRWCSGGNVPMSPCNCEQCINIKFNNDPDYNTFDDSRCVGTDKVPACAVYVEEENLNP